MRETDIKAVVFDWGGVLIEHPIEKLMAYIGHYLAVPLDRLRPLMKARKWEFQTGTLGEMELWGQVRLELDHILPIEGFVRLWEEAFEWAYLENKEMFALARQLKQEGYVIGFLSNTEKPAVSFFNRQKYDDIFDVTVFSCSEGVAKPEAGIYRRTVERLGLEPDEIVFIDDSPENIEGAVKAGWLHSLQFTSMDRLRSELEDLGVLSKDQSVK